MCNMETLSTKSLRRDHVKKMHIVFDIFMLYIGHELKSHIVLLYPATERYAFALNYTFYLNQLHAV